MGPAGGEVGEVEHIRIWGQGQDRVRPSPPAHFPANCRAELCGSTAFSTPAFTSVRNNKTLAAPPSTLSLRTPWCALAIAAPSCPALQLRWLLILFSHYLARSSQTRGTFLGPLRPLPHHIPPLTSSLEKGTGL